MAAAGIDVRSAPEQLAHGDGVASLDGLLEGRLHSHPPACSWRTFRLNRPLADWWPLMAEIRPRPLQPRTAEGEFEWLSEVDIVSIGRGFGSRF
jgi:hypothetical protein